MFFGAVLFFREYYCVSHILKLSLTETLTSQDPNPCCNRYALSTFLASWYGFAIFLRDKKTEIVQITKIQQVNKYTIVISKKRD